MRKYMNIHVLIHPVYVRMVDMAPVSLSKPIKLIGSVLSCM